MVSTFIDYNLITRDMKLSLQRTSEQVLVKREADYYKANIGNVTSVDAFMDDYRLFNYAMKAHGLEDMAYAKAFMRKVLESDLSDEDSYANMLTDERYRKFAEAFSFSTSTSVVQSDAQEDAVIGLYSQSYVNQDAAVRSDSAYFNAAIDRVTNADEIWQNDRLKNYVFQAFGLDSKYTSYEQFKGVITSDVSDPASFVNVQAAAYKQGFLDKIANVQATATPEDLANPSSAAYKLIVSYQSKIDNAPDYTPLAAAFNFQLDGTLASGDLPMADAQKAATNEAYVFQQPRLSTSAALLDKLYYETTIDTITTVDSLLSNRRMLNYIVVAYGLPSTTLIATLNNVMTSDPDDPASYVNTSTDKNKSIFQEIARAYNFQSDGTLASGDTPQTATQMAATSGGYIDRYNDSYEAADTALISSYKTLMSLVVDVDDMLDDKKIMTLVLQAFGLENEGDSIRKLKKVLTSDLNDPKSYANSLKDSRYVELAKAFNFNADGTLGTPLMAQSESDILNTASGYVVQKSRFGTEEDKTAATAESKYYSAEVGKLASLDDLLDNRRLVDFILVAAGIDPEEIETDYVRQMFESDLDDPDSFVNTEPDTRYRELVASFNFNVAGQIEKPTSGQIQSRRGLIDTMDLYLNQTLEETEGEDNAGVRLALYFQRMASSVNNAYDLLADSALLQVIQTTFNIPSEMSSADVDLQYDYINRVLDVEDLHDPEALNKLLVRFTALYDIENNIDVSAGELILSGSGGGGISADTLLSLSQLRSGGL
ncbi:DUF1217 domain-containing protein [Pararhizobium antarcticum]|uniref:Flagellar protein n=1 Tax=Pararhizobium antarcticum TaxID=1798805 RepID=A0A657LPA9_9HYPH|nr:DUF1217 domain-containing protein [Pararhizobium antarcticum]OJF94012.1 flagellar protein [Pararhizobium antarcticum]OJF97551.1 flagellar protein [Rhizobium sp. 58]